MTRILLLAVLLSTPGVAQNVYSGQPWDWHFRESWIAQAKGEFSKARKLTAEGWALVSAAGPSAFGYSDGVEQAYATAVIVNGPLSASRFYSEALAATKSRTFISVRLQILIREAFRYSQHQEVAANAAYEEALALIGSMPSPPGYFGQMLKDFADLKGRMGDPETSAKLLTRAASAPYSAPIPYPRFGMQDIPTEPILGHDPLVKTLVEQACRLIREGQFEGADIVAEQAFALNAGLPHGERYWEDGDFESIALAYSTAGHKNEAAAVLEREIAASAQQWGSGDHTLAGTLESVAWRYINYLQMFGPAHELIDRAARIIAATDGPISDGMSGIEQARSRLAELERNPAAVAEHQARIREIWVAVHGANTKPLVLY